jgi:hypothetical protein
VHSLAGLVRCGGCGYALHKTKTSPQGAVRLLCRTRRGLGADACPGVGAPALSQVEALVLVRVAEVIADLRTDVGAARRRAARARSRVDSRALQRQIAETERAVLRATEQVARGLIPEPAYRQVVAELDGQLAALRVRLAEAEDVAVLPAAGKSARAAEELLRLWPVMTSQERNRSLRLVVRAVILRPPHRRGEPLEGRVEVQQVEDYPR